MQLGDGNAGSGDGEAFPTLDTVNDVPAVVTEVSDRDVGHEVSVSLVRHRPSEMSRYQEVPSYDRG